MDFQELFPEESAWPDGLNHASPVPKRLFLRGRLPKIPGIAVVGTRRMSVYGHACTQMLVPAIVRLGLPIVSGLALGIDGAAHETALQCGGATFGVIGGGLDARSFFPKAHRALAARMTETGGVISEYPPGTSPLPYHFPARNRIVAALCRAVLVVEAPHKSGAMITAKLALDMGREVWAVPGPITHPNSEGPNSLIRNGATPITGPEDIASALGFETEAARQGSLFDLAALGNGEREIAEKLLAGLDTADALARALRLSVIAVSTHLTALELKGLVRSIGGGRYVLSMK